MSEDVSSAIKLVNEIQVTFKRRVVLRVIQIFMSVELESETRPHTALVDE